MNTITRQVSSFLEITYN